MNFHFLMMKIINHLYLKLFICMNNTKTKRQVKYTTTKYNIYVKELD